MTAANETAGLVEADLDSVASAIRELPTGSC